jgi:glutathione S-transferase
MYLTAWVTLAAIAVYLWVSYNVGVARIKYGVKAPAMDGPDEFLVRVRVQMNTLEQMPVLLAPLWICAVFLGDKWAAAGGLLWCIGRVAYALGYYAAPKKREAGFGIALSAVFLLICGSAVGLVMH